MNKTLISTMMICGAGFALASELEVIGLSEENGSLSLTTTKAVGVDMTELFKDFLPLAAEASCDELNELEAMLGNTDPNLFVELGGSLQLDVIIRASTDDPHLGETMWGVVSSNVEIEETISIDIGDFKVHCD